MQKDSELDDFIADVTAKIQLLKFTQGKTTAIVKNGKTVTMERQRNALRSMVEDIDILKRKVEQAKFKSGETTEDVAGWSQDIDAVISEADAMISMVEESIDEVRSNEEKRKREEEKVLTERAREEQLKFERAQLEQKLEFERKLDESRTNQTPATKAPSKVHLNTKLPELKITRFDGSYANWLPFWNKFEAEINTANLAPVTKFAYLKELVEPKIRTEIDGLPFTIEGYERAKTILTSEYGKTSEIVNAYVQNIMNLPTITGSHPTKVHEFYTKLLFNVQSLETLGRLQDVKGNVRSVIEKLKGIKSDLVGGEVGWQDWDFPKLVQALKKWKDIHQIETSEKPKEKPPPLSRTFQARDNTHLPRGCVFCDDNSHKSVNCDKVTTVPERKKKLSEKRLCFNCTGGKHRAAECKSRSVCQVCQRKHHTSICDKVSQDNMLTAKNETGAVCHPVVVVEINGVKCRALLDTGAGSSYASAALLHKLHLQPERSEIRRIEMMIGTTTKRVEIFRLQVRSMNGDFTIETEVTKVDRKELLILDNPRYAEMMRKYSHLQGVVMEDQDSKAKLPVHLILGASEYTRIKTGNCQKVGKIGEPVAEKTRLGWTIMSSAAEEVDVKKMFMTQTSVADYEALCRLDVLGLEDSPTGDQQTVYAEFREQLKHSSEGWYETGLPWKGGHPPLPSNEKGSLRRLDNLVRKLEKTQRLEEYDAVIQDQLSQGVVERVDAPATRMEFYLPHKAVVRESATSTKLRVVYDASAREHQDAPSINECLEVGPPLQNRLWEVLVRNRFHPVAIAGDLKQAFLQVRIKEEDRDALRFHWFKDLRSKQIETLRFTRALFGLAPSPFLLGGVIKEHLESCREEYPKYLDEIERSIYVDDLIMGGPTVQEAENIKNTAIEVFEKAKFKLHKWGSNVSRLEQMEDSVGVEGKSYAKQQLGLESGASSLLGLAWDKREDTVGVGFPVKTAEPTKRGILGKVARIYDPLGLTSPITLRGKLLYRDACDEKCGWDAKLPGELTKRWTRWETELPKQETTTPRSIPKHQEVIGDIVLHAFGDASGKGVAAACYAVVRQPSGVSQGLVAAKARLAKKGLTIPRLELVAGHMAANLAHNVREALEGFPVSQVFCWLDSTVALHWIQKPGEYKQFVSNRVHKIHERGETTWRHVGTKENPADLASRGGNVDDQQRLWWTGPEWLKSEEEWPVDIITTQNEATLVETKATRTLFAVALAENTAEKDDFDNLLAKWNLWRTLRISAWVTRFLRNTRSPKESRAVGPLTTAEISDRSRWWERRVQERAKESKHFQEDRLRLNLQLNENHIYECRGRIQGQYPTYLPDEELYTQRVVERAHEATLHGGVNLTMTKVREDVWVSRLRRLTKRVIKSCHGCRRFQAVALAKPPPGILPKDRTTGQTAFQVIGVDFAGPLRYRTKNRKEAKAYIVLYACSLTRALFLELLKSMETEEFWGSLKRLIARRGRPTKIYSDNGGTFVGAAKWLKTVMRDERFNNFLAQQNIQWQFNLSRAPWWGGQFERMVGLVKQALYKSIGGGHLAWSELQDVLLDVEVALNNRPLCYVEDDVQMPILTPNSLMFIQPNTLPEIGAHHLETKELRKRARYLQRCKDAVWKRWTNEYLRALRERHNLKHKSSGSQLKEGDVMLIKSDERNRGKWKMGIVKSLIRGRDGVVRAARLKTGQHNLERAVQQLYPLELSSDQTIEATEVSLNAEAQPFRPRRDAAVAATCRIQDITEEEDE